MTLEEFYARIGGNYQETLRRLPSEKMIRKFVGKYVADPSYQELDAALAKKDWEAAFRAAHTLKGVAQNLGLDQLQRVSSALTEALRGGKPLTEPALLEAVKVEQARTLEALSELDT